MIVQRVLAGLLLIVMLSAPGWTDESTGQSEAERRADEVLATTDEPPAESLAIASSGEEPVINVLDLIFRGGPLMVPIGLMSLLVVTVGIERSLALRRRRVMPRRLVASLSNLTPQPDGFDPRQAYQLCQQHPSTAATVIQAMLLKVGRPHAEVERAVAESSQREAARLYSNVRTLNLAAAVTPLIGLLGTVWGMIQAFFATANMPTGVNKAALLADGIYVALVTTAGGLAVAIPAAILAHYFESRIQRLFRDLDELLFSLLPQVEQFEGQLRVRRQQLSGESTDAPADNPASPA